VFSLATGCTICTRNRTGFSVRTSLASSRWRVIATNLDSLARFPNCELDYGQRLSARISLSILVRMTAARREASSACTFRDSSGNFSMNVALGGDTLSSAPQMAAAILAMVSASRPKLAPNAAACLGSPFACQTIASAAGAVSRLSQAIG
jgi:hypothetical protein